MDEMNRAEVKKKHSNLRKKSDKFLELHERYGIYRIVSEDTKGETEAISVEEKYFGAVSEEVYISTRFFYKYKKISNEGSTASCREKIVSGL